MEQYFSELPENHQRDGINLKQIIGISVFDVEEIIFNIKLTSFKAHFHSFLLSILFDQSVRYS